MPSMLQSNELIELLVVLLQITVVIGIPFVVSHGGELAIHLAAHHEFAEIPILTTLARLQGLLTGGLLLYVNFDESYFDLQGLFMHDGRWNLTWSQFLLQRSNVFTYQWLPLLRLLSDLPARSGWLALLVCVILPAMLIALCLRYWPLRDALRGLLACAGTALWSAWLTIYLVCLIFWGLFLLNFWSLALAALYIQYRRHGHSH
jgi:hypothetical protein